MSSIFLIFFLILEVSRGHIPGQQDHHHMHSFMGPMSGHHHAVMVEPNHQMAHHYHQMAPNVPHHHQMAPNGAHQHQMVPQHHQMAPNVAHQHQNLHHNHKMVINNQYNDHDHDHHPHLIPSVAPPPNQHHHVHHVSHSLPGKSSVAIQRFYVAPPRSPTFHLHQPVVQQQQLRQATTQQVIQATAQQQQVRQGRIFVQSVPAPTTTRLIQISPHQAQSVPFPPTASRLDPHTSSRSQPQAASVSSQDEAKFHPFEPRFSVAREEVSDEEWKAEIKETFDNSGLIPGVLRSAPEGLVNVNYGTHNCVHMGTNLGAETSAYEPTAVSFPAKNQQQLHTLIMADVDHKNKPRLHWLVVNIPGAKVSEGDVIAEYDAPAPERGSGDHRYVFTAFKQERGRIAASEVAAFISRPCRDRGRDRFDSAAFAAANGLKTDPVAANYFTVKFDDFAGSIAEYCADKRKS